jgi:predicted SAM-dependent methyltransferase
MRLHVGCGRVYLPGWVNVDIRSEEVKVDVCADLKYLPFQDHSFDLIYACHVLEHFGRYEYLSILGSWKRLLVPGGSLRISVPDFGQILRSYKNTKDLSELMGLLYGGQTSEYNYHKVCFDFRSLRRDLFLLGFNWIYRYDWRSTDHSNFDDFSQAYLPHMNKENGMLMSLNVEAR